MISYVGSILYILYIFSINYMRLNHYKKDSFNWLNVVTMILLIMVLIFGNSITISSSNFRFSGTTDYILGNQVLWSVDTPELFFPILFGTLLLFTFGIDKLWSNPDVIETNGIILIIKLLMYGGETEMI